MPDGPSGPRVLPVDAVLFDLDGTLADTAPDLGAALNRVRTDRGLEPVPLAAASPARIARRARPPGRRHVGRAGRSGLRDAARSVPYALCGGAVRRDARSSRRSTPCSPRSTRARSPGASSPTRRRGSPRLCSTRCSSPRAQAPWSAATRRPSPSRIPRRSHSPPSSSASRRRAASTWATHAATSRRAGRLECGRSSRAGATSRPTRRPTTWPADGMLDDTGRAARLAAGLGS